MSQTTVFGIAYYHQFDSMAVIGIIDIHNVRESDVLLYFIYL